MVIVSALTPVGVLAIETGVTMETSVVVSTVTGKEGSIVSPGGDGGGVVLRCGLCPQIQ